MMNMDLIGSGYDGAVAFVVGPATRPKGSFCGARYRINDEPLFELAVIAAEYGKTTLLDSYGGSVIFGGAEESDVELF
jgi:hypothetical protein